jgi:hypothetical protein
MSQTTRDVPHRTPKVVRAAAEELLRQHGLDREVALSVLEDAALLWREAERMAAGPTSPEIAAEYDRAAEALEALSEAADHGACVAIGPPYRAGWSKRQAAELRALAAARRQQDPSWRRYIGRRTIRAVIWKLALAWAWGSTEAEPEDRHARAYRDKNAETGWAGNRGAAFVREATALVTGQERPAFQVIASVIEELKKAAEEAEQTPP